jgi:hypothetical protein
MFCYVIETRTVTSAKARLKARLVYRPERPANAMGPRPSISGELPLESYFSSAGRTAGPSGTKGNRSLKRKNAVDASESDAAWAPTKKPKMKAPSKSSHAGPESSEICTLNRS